MRRSLVALSFGTLLLGIAEFVMMGILPYVASELKVTIAQAGHLISAYAIGVSVGGARANTGAEISAEENPAGAGVHDNDRQHAGLGLSQLLDDDGREVHIRPAARGIFRRGFHRGGEARGEGQKRGGGFHNDFGNDGRKPVRRAAGHGAERINIVAHTIHACRRGKPDSAVLHMALGARRRRRKRHGAARSVQISQEARAVAAALRHSARQRRHITSTRCSSTFRGSPKAP